MTLPDGMRALTDFDPLRQTQPPSARLPLVRQLAVDVRQRLLAAPPVRCFQSIDLVRVPYPRAAAFPGVYRRAVTGLALLHLLKRLFVIQYQDFDDRLRTLLFSPCDAQAHARSPRVQRLTDALPARLQRLSRAVVAPVYRSVPEALSDIGLLPAQVDLLGYCHLRHESVSRWLGDGTQPGLFPRAQLLVQAAEWADARAGQDLPAARVPPLSGSVALGPGVALLQTPGLTGGHQSLVLRLPDGLRVITDNGVGADAYAPMHSRIAAVRRYAQRTGHEVIPRGRRAVAGDDHYLSMVLEKTVAGPSHHPDYPNCISASEAAPYGLFPGFQPSLRFGETCVGTLQWQD